MNDQTVHDTFVIERTLPATPAQVFHAFADQEAKGRWFGGEDAWEQTPHEMDFRVGGSETIGGGPKDGPLHTFHCRYHDIQPDERIVYTYEMRMDGVPSSVSVATIQIEPVADGTRLTVTEQGVYFDGPEGPRSRLSGTEWLMDKMADSLPTAANAG